MGTEINGIVGKAKAIASVVNTLVIAPSIVIYGALVLSGYLPFKPFDEIRADVREHRLEVNSAVRRAESVDQKLIETLIKMATVMDRVERRDRLIDCYTRFKDVPDLFKRCME